MHPRFRLVDALTFATVVAIAAMVYKNYWGAPFFNARILFSLFLGTVTTTGVGAILGREQWRQFFCGYCSFGVAYLATVLRGGYGWVPDAYAELFSKYSLMGICLCVAFGLLSHIAFRERTS